MNQNKKYNYSLIVSQKGNSYISAIVLVDDNFLETSKEFAKELIGHKKGEATGSYTYLGDLNLTHQEGEGLRSKYIINHESGDIYFIQGDHISELYDDFLYYVDKSSFRFNFKLSLFGKEIVNTNRLHDKDKVFDILGKHYRVTNKG